MIKFIGQLLLGLMLCCKVEAAQVEKTPSLLIFGDSLSDTGAGYAISQTLDLPPIPPAPYYYQGRYCNGPVWVDYLTDSLKIPVLNFAVGGAQSGEGQILQPFGYELGGLFDQIERFESCHKKISPNTLVIVAIGSNDFLSLLFTPAQLTKEGVFARSSQILCNITSACTWLEELGARRIVLWNIPNLGMVPKFNEDSPLHALAPLMSGAALQFNLILADFVKQWNGSGSKTQIIYYDVNRVLTEIGEDLEKKGVDLSGHILNCYLHHNPHLIEWVGSEDGSFFFYDQTHPTTIVWKQFAQEFKKFLRPLLHGLKKQLFIYNSNFNMIIFSLLNKTIGCYSRIY